MERDKVLQLLQSHGEALSADDLAQCFRALLGTSDISKVRPPRDTLSPEMRRELGRL